MPIILDEIGSGGIDVGSAFDTASDVFRIVDRYGGGQVNPLFDLNTGVGYYRERDSFVFTPGAGTAQQSRSGRRYGGSRTVGMTHENGTIAWTAVVRGSTQMELVQRIETLLSEIEEESHGRWIEWRAPGVAYSSFPRISGPGTWQPRYQWREWAGSGFSRVEVSFPVHPLVEWDPMTVQDNCDVNLMSRYVFDSGTAAMMTHVPGSINGEFAATSNFTTERRAIWMEHGYRSLEGMAMVMTEPSAAFSGYKMGVVLRRSSANTYIDVYQDDNGTNTRLRIDVVIGGTRTNRYSSNVTRFASVLAQHVVRAWIVGQTVYVSTSLPNFDTTAATTSYTLTGGEQTSLIAGYTGWTWTPQNAGADFEWFYSTPYYWMSDTPAVNTLTGIPGNAPAKADVQVIRPAAGSAPWGLLSWAKSTTPISTYFTPFGIVQAEAANGGSSANWASAADAAYLGGNGFQDTSVTGADEYNIMWMLAAHRMDPDAFSGDQITMEVWARFKLSSTLVSPRAVISVRPSNLTAYAIRYSDEYGSVGRPLPVPNSTQLRIVRLGTVTFPVERDKLYPLFLNLQVFTAAGSSGTLGLDYVAFTPSRARAATPTGRVLDTSYPAFINTNGSGKLVHSDLSARISSSSYSNSAEPPDHGMSGSQLLLPPGDVSLFTLLSNTVPDDPTNLATADTTPMAATISVNVTPRSFMFRNTE